MIKIVIDTTRKIQLNNKSNEISQLLLRNEKKPTTAKTIDTNATIFK